MRRSEVEQDEACWHARPAEVPMTDVSTVIDANREAVNELIAASEAMRRSLDLAARTRQMVAESDRRARRAID
jgi:hypothetical protein